MTRFARAKGSKSSNLKTPEDSTPWEVMKEQLLKSKKDNEESKNREEAEKQRIENYNNFLKEHKTQKRKATWCDFPEAQINKYLSSITVPNENANQVKNKKKKLNNDKNVSNSEKYNITKSIDANEEKKLGKKKKNKKTNNNNTVSSSQQTEQGKHNEESKVKLQENQNQVTEDIIQTQNSNDGKKKTSKKQKQFSEKKSDTDLSTNNLVKEINQPEATQKKRNKKNKKQKQTSEPIVNENDKLIHKEEVIEEQVSNANNNITLKKKKNRNRKGDKPERRKPIQDKSFHLIINSKDVQLIRYDGFPIMKKDADRLEELKKSMMQKGIPKSEVQRTMKLERRRAEKALARLKRDVCYNCRKGGHNLSDCPDLKTNIPGGIAEGVCFKCGSTEHRQFECKVQRDKEFRFATCFICKESGHIARQCPDNPKGLYPNGGCCKLCGDVTHLRKDCPVMDKKEGTSIKLQTLSSDNIEDIAQNDKPTIEATSKKPKKIKF